MSLTFKTSVRDSLNDLTTLLEEAGEEEAETLLDVHLLGDQFLMVKPPHASYSHMNSSGSPCKITPREQCHSGTFVSILITGILEKNTGYSRTLW